MVAKYLYMLVIMMITLSGNGQIDNIVLEGQKIISTYQQDITIGVHVLEDSTVILISHAVRSEEEGVSRLAIVRRLDQNLNILSESPFLLDYSSNGGGYLLESYDFEVDFSEKGIFIVAFSDRSDCDDTDRRRYTLLHYDHDGTLINHTSWCKELFNDIMAIDASPEDSLVYIISEYGIGQDLYSELTTIPMTFDVAPQFTTIYAPPTNFAYIIVRHDTVFLAGTLNYDSQYFGPTEIWRGYIHNDSIVYQHRFHFFEDLVLRRYIQEEDSQYYVAGTGNSNASIYRFRGDQFVSNIFRGTRANMINTHGFGDERIATSYLFRKLGYEYSQLGFDIINSDGYDHNQFIFDLPGLQYMSESVLVDDTIYAFAVGRPSVSKQTIHIYKFLVE